MAKTGWTRRHILGSTGAGLTLASSRVYAAPAFTPRAALRSLVASGQSAVCHLADYGQLQILICLFNGAPTEGHARRNGLYLPKDIRQSRSLKPLSPLDFTRLINTAGGLDRGVNGTMQQDDFLALYKTLEPAVSVPVACPSDFRSLSHAEQAQIRRQPDNGRFRKYLTCFPPDAPASRRPLFSDSLFSAWFAEFDNQGHFFGLSLPGVRAVWSLEP